jgi:glycine reductase
MLKNKKLIIIGDKDGVTASAIEQCLKDSEAEIVFSADECFA